MDEEGFMEIVDRTKDMVNVAGFKVYTEELDKYLCNHPAVFNAGVIGLPDPKRPGAEIVKACVQLRGGYEPSKDSRPSIRSINWLYEREGAKGYIKASKIKE